MEKLIDTFVNWENAFQLFGCMLLLIASWVISTKLHTVLAGKKFFNVIEPLAMPGLFLGSTAVSYMIANNFGDMRVIWFSVVASGLWVCIRLISNIIENTIIARIASVVAWTIAVLSITGYLDDTIKILEMSSFSIGKSKITLFAIIKIAIVLSTLLFIFKFLSRMLENYLHRVSDMSSSAKVLVSKLFKYVTYSASILIAVNTTNIDFTFLAVLTGAIGVGIGFGLQKPASNLVCGLILIIDSSIKPGDVIEVTSPSGGSTYGVIRSLKARYTEIETLEGKSHLIPNEELFTQRVINWSHGNPAIRSNVTFEVEKTVDPRTVIDIGIKAADGVARVSTLPGQEVACVLREIRGYSYVFRIYFWIIDPQNGIAQIQSDILLNLDTLLKVNGIKVPNVQQNILVVKDVNNSANIG